MATHSSRTLRRRGPATRAAGSSASSPNSRLASPAAGRAHRRGDRAGPAPARGVPRHRPQHAVRVRARRERLHARRRVGSPWACALCHAGSCEQSSPGTTRELVRGETLRFAHFPTTSRTRRCTRGRQFAARPEVEPDGPDRGRRAQHVCVLATGAIRDVPRVAGRRSWSACGWWARSSPAASIESASSRSCGPPSRRSRQKRELEARLEEIRQLKALEDENVYLRTEVRREAGFDAIVGQSPAILDVLARVAQVAPTDSPVLLLGETGTGKELLAHAIHDRSPRRARPS